VEYAQHRRNKKLLPMRLNVSSTPIHPYPRQTYLMGSIQRLDRCKGSGTAKDQVSYGSNPHHRRHGAFVGSLAVPVIGSQRNETFNFQRLAHPISMKRVRVFLSSGTKRRILFVGVTFSTNDVMVNLVGSAGRRLTVTTVLTVTVSSKYRPSESKDWKPIYS